MGLFRRSRADRLLVDVHEALEGPESFVVQPAAPVMLPPPVAPPPPVALSRRERKKLDKKLRRKRPGAGWSASPYVGSERLDPHYDGGHYSPHVPPYQGSRSTYY